MEIAITLIVVAFGLFLIFVPMDGPPDGMA
jgi:hypothetical protein